LGLRVCLVQGDGHIQGQHSLWVGERPVVPLAIVPVWDVVLNYLTTFDQRLFRLRRSCSHGQDEEEGKDDQVKLMHRGTGEVWLGVENSGQLRRWCFYSGEARDDRKCRLFGG
jgi:hypothetical protein